MENNINNKVELTFLQTIKKYNMINKGDTIILGLSGGCDSVSLFTLLQKYKDKFEIKIICVHINHLIREESFNDEKFCVKLCEKFNTKLYIHQIDVDKLAKEKKLSSEEMGREIRYKKFNALVKNETYKIAIAHNKDDVAETFLMRLFRGSGINGLKSIAPKRANIIRPIIEIERQYLELYLKTLNQKYCTDKTNFLPLYTRNKIRLNVLPIIKKDFNNNIVSTLYNTSKILEEENDFIEKTTNETFKSLAIENKEDSSITLDLIMLTHLHSYLQKQIVIKTLSYFIPNNKNITKKHIDSIIKILNTDCGEKTLNFPNNLKIVKNYNKLFFTNIIVNNNSNYDIHQVIEPNKLNKVNNTNLYLYYKVLNEREKKDFSNINSSSNINSEIFTNTVKSTINYENLSKDIKVNVVKSQFFCYYNVYDYLHIKVRNRNNGDSINIKNIGTKKLKNYFIDNKIPKDLRSNIPIITLNDDILWVLDNYNNNFSIVNNNYIAKSENNILFVLMEDYNE